MRHLLTAALVLAISCSNKVPDTGESEVLCPGDSIYIEVCIDCGEDGSCENVDFACRSVCEADEDCPADKTCLTTDDGKYCDVFPECS